MVIAAVVLCACVASAVAPVEGPSAPPRRARLTNYALNRHVRLLDGQWQGTILASDGNVYFGGGSHNPELGAALFRYEPKTGKLALLVENVTTVCGEDPQKTPPQGKIHSPVVEHAGWIYFGTHLANYTVEGRKAYPGAHLLGYQLGTGKFRDFGVIHPNYTNYSALGLDARRGCVYFYVTPFYEGEGSRLYRIDVATGKKQDLGLVGRWTNRRDHGPPSYHCFVDARGDCWLTVRYERTLYVARAASGTIEAWPDALPEAVVQSGSRDPWKALRPLDDDRALVLMAGGMWVFDSREAPRGKRTFTRLSAATAGVLCPGRRALLLDAANRAHVAAAVAQCAGRQPPGKLRPWRDHRCGRPSPHVGRRPDHRRPRHRVHGRPLGSLRSRHADHRRAATRHADGGVLLGPRRP